MSTEPYAVVARQLRAATETATELWQQGARALTEQAQSLASLPTFNPNAAMQRYFELLTQAVEVNRELASQWVSAVTGMTESLMNQSGSEAGTAPETGLEDTSTEAAVSEEVSEAAAAETERTITTVTRQAAAAQRAAAEGAREQARAPYLGLSKAALVKALSERKLPRSGTIEQLISRLVAADLDS